MAGKFFTVFFAVATVVMVLIFAWEGRPTPPMQEVLAEAEITEETTMPLETLPDPRQTAGKSP